VKYSRLPATLALFTLLLASSSFAQIHGVPPSVTSVGFGGRGINGTPPSVTSLGPRGFAPRNPGFRGFPHAPHDRDHHHHHDGFGNAFYPYYPYLYGYDDSGTYAGDGSDANSDDNDPDYQGGPTVFDRRGSGADSYVPPSYPGPAHAPRPEQAGSQPDVANTSQSTVASSVTPQIPTTLVFKDGRQIEVGNYAIVGQTLFDLTPGHPRKIALADLDLAATEKQNEDHGVTFQLPASAQGN
jgi:hypothetical protein